MKKLVYPRERTLGVITLVLGAIVWVALIVGTFGGALLALGIGYVAYLFAHSALIAHIKGNGVELSERQFPELYAQFRACCEKLQMAKPPRAFILNGNGGLNAFATKFAGTHYVVLLSDVVDAMAEHADGVKFYMGHELAHLRLRHLGILHLIRWPVLWLPLVGAAYSRARETSCDRHGLACCESGEGAARSLVALAAGPAQWKRLDLPAWLEQAKQASGFWMSFHELIAGYPWLTKRTLRVMQPEGAMPRRNGFAYALAIFVPYAGRLGAGFATLILIYIVGVMAAVAIPAYNDYKARAVYSVSVDESQPVRDALGSYFLSHKQVPESLAAVGVEPKLPDGTELALDTDNMVLTLSTKGGEIYMVPSLDDAGNVVWRCEGSDKVKPSQLPASCR